jgi:hypothetical protein
MSLVCHIWDCEVLSRAVMELKLPNDRPSWLYWETPPLVLFGRRDLVWVTGLCSIVVSHVPGFCLGKNKRQ